MDRQELCYCSNQSFFIDGLAKKGISACCESAIFSMQMTEYQYDY